MLIRSIDMRRPFIKTSIVGIIFLALLYYSVAWAVLRCPHQENHLDQEAALYDINAVEISILLDEHQANIDCTGPKYHTESLAGSSAATEILRLTRDFDSQVDAFPTLPHITRGQLGDVWALFYNGSSSIILIHLPRYLLLSVLRF